MHLVKLQRTRPKTLNNLCNLKNDSKISISEYFDNTLFFDTKDTFQRVPSKKVNKIQWTLHWFKKSTIFFLMSNV